ncbi:MAG TPA: ATP-binding protein [Oxalicibacterium sp.]|nr:ATP-binding protein [Oxalicibacterium sp.]
MTDALELRILICTPHAKDASLASSALEQAGFSCTICRNLGELMEQIHRGVGAVLTVEEALPDLVSSTLLDYVSTQATWSDLPILMLTKSGSELTWAHNAYEGLGNLTLLERPVRAPTLLTAARSALRARQRQYEIRLADQRKDEFLAMLGHELRNPLAPISAAASMLELVPDDSSRVRLASRIIARQVGHMTNLINDLLDVARVTRGLITLDKQALDLRDILSEAVEQVRPLIDERRHRLALHLPPETASVLGDRKRLVQVVVNILNNASKYTPEGGEIDARLDVHDKEVRLDITDNGIGMAPELIAHAFDLFAQAERTSDRSQGGLGLGLALVKNLVESHGGKVSASSGGIGKGSTFSISLSRLAEALPAQNGSDMQQLLPMSATPLRIMVVDDNRDAANTLQMFLNMAGHKTLVEYAAHDAIERAGEISPDVYLLDIGLPDMDGLQLARTLRAMPEASASTFIAITGYSQELDREKSRDAGFDHHFVKPIDTPQLLALLAQIDAPSQERDLS